MSWYRRAVLTPTENETMFGKYHQMNIEDDQFIHFTTQQRANEIIQSQKLLVNSPYPGFGAQGAFAISTTYGDWLPSVQTDHIKNMQQIDDSPVVGVVFKTNAKPVSAYPDEVTWYDDVDIFDSYIISLSEAKNILENQENNILEEDDGVFYHDNFDDFTQYNKDKRQQKEINASYEDLGWEKIG